MKTYTYFKPTPTTAEELKSQYRKLAMQHHPDRGGSTKAMQAINNEFDDLFSLLKNIHKTKDGTTYTARQSSTETADSFKDLIAELMKLDGITIEIIGCFVWVSGDTRPNKDRLKTLGFHWHSTKNMWYLKPETYRRKSRRDYDMEEIRGMYGTSGEVQSQGTVKLEEVGA
jgi:curved DNA-binding protein CbpA